MTDFTDYSSRPEDDLYLQAHSAALSKIDYLLQAADIPDDLMDLVFGDDDNLATHGFIFYLLLAMQLFKKELAPENKNMLSAEDIAQYCQAQAEALYPEINADISKRRCRELQPGAYFVINSLPLPGREGRGQMALLIDEQQVAKACSFTAAENVSTADKVRPWWQEDYGIKCDPVVMLDAEDFDQDQLIALCRHKVKFIAPVALNFPPVQKLLKKNQYGIEQVLQRPLTLQGSDGCAVRVKLYLFRRIREWRELEEEENNKYLDLLHKLQLVGSDVDLETLKEVAYSDGRVKHPWQGRRPQRQQRELSYEQRNIGFQALISSCELPPDQVADAVEAQEWFQETMPLLEDWQRKNCPEQKLPLYQQACTSFFLLDALAFVKIHRRDLLEAIFHAGKALEAKADEPSVLQGS